MEKKRAVNWNAYKPRYFFINGRSMPDTLAPNRASYLPSQPYSGFVHINPHDQRPDAGVDSYNEPALIRYVNAGTVTYPFHPHGNSQRVIARDGRELKGAALQDLTYDKFLLDVGPGQTLDTLLTWTDIDLFNPIDQLPGRQGRHSGAGRPDDHRHDVLQPESRTWASRPTPRRGSRRTTRAVSTTTWHTATRCSSRPTTAPRWAE